MEFLVSCSLSSRRQGEISLVKVNDKEEILDYYHIQKDPGVHEEGSQGMVVIDNDVYTGSANKICKFRLDTLEYVSSSEAITNSPYGAHGMAAGCAIKSDIHGICKNQDRLFCVFSDSDILVEYDLDLKIIKKYYTAEWNTEFSRYDKIGEKHVNSVFVDKNRDAYLTVHNYNNEGYVFKKNLDNWNSEPGHVVLTGLNQPHDYLQNDDGVAICDSNNTALVVKRFPIEQSLCINIGYYTRGLDYDNKNYYVGCTSREDGKKAIAIVPKDWLTRENRTVSYVHLPDATMPIDDNKFLCAEIYDVKRIG